MMSTFISFLFLLSSHCFCQLISEYPNRNEIFVFGSHNSLRAPTHIRLFYLACNSIDLLNRHHFVFSFGSLFSLLILNGSDAYAYILIFFIHNFPLEKYYCFCFCLSRCNSISKFIGLFHFIRLLFGSHRLQDVIRVCYNRIFKHPLRKIYTRYKS